MKGLIDSTLREGEQTVGVSFTLAQKIKIITQLTRVGIEEIELGVTSVRNPELAVLIHAARQVAGAGRTALWCRCLPADIDCAIALQPDVLSLSIPASDLHLRKKIGRDRSWAISAMDTAIRQAHSSAIPFISVGFEDATRADKNFLVQLAVTAEKAGARRLRLADTVGIASPAVITSLVKEIRQHSALEIGVHTHNDFGMATANAIAALEAGADWADVTVLGLGERAGNARLEEITGYLALNSKKRTYNMQYLKNLCREVAQAAKNKISPRHPVIGEQIFSCESGLHLQGLLREPSTYEPFSPDMVGTKRNLLFGKKIGRRAVADHLAFLGLAPDADRLDDAVASVHRLAGRIGRPLNDTEFAALAKGNGSGLMF